jgi:hypothetical protein
MPFNIQIMQSFEPIFSIAGDEQFEKLALEIFQRQYKLNAVYREYINARRIDAETVTQIDAIPFLPIEFFKSRDVVCGTSPPQTVFLSSGTSATGKSRHMVSDLRVYRQSIVNGFSRMYGDPEKVQFLALVPTPDQAPDSSLVYMLRHLMDMSSSPENGFFMASHSGLRARLIQKHAPGRKIILIGLAYALLDFAEKYPGKYNDIIVVETGGMKGHRQEMIRQELHDRLCNLLGVDTIHSEYGMTELLSQAWSDGNGMFRTPPWMKIGIRQINDPLGNARPGETGGINIIDLANINSSSFIATQDLGRLHPDGRFEVLGRFDDAEARGCSLMI